MPTKRWLSNVPKGLVRQLYGQHLLNGVLVAIGVATVGTIGAGTGVITGDGLSAGLTTGLGALCVSLTDQPESLANKAKMLGVAWVLAALGGTLAALAVFSPPHEMAVVLGMGLLSGLVLAWGRWAIPLSVISVLSVVYAQGAPLENIAEAHTYIVFFVVGGALYLPTALGLSHLVKRHDRRLAISECLHDFAHTLRAGSELYDQRGYGHGPAPLGHYLAERHRINAMTAVIAQQSALAEHLLTTRGIVFRDHQNPIARQQAVALVILLDCLDILISASADHAPRRLSEAGSPLGPAVAEVLRILADDLDHLATSHALGLNPLDLPDRRPLIAALAPLLIAAEEAAGQGGDDPEHQHLILAVRLTVRRCEGLVSEIAHLPAVLSGQADTESFLRGSDLVAFIPTLGLGWKPLWAGLSRSSPIFRHAVRFSLALGFAYGLLEIVPGLSHGNWVLLTIAVILRGSYSLTLQRRNQRIIGTLQGCLISLGLLAVLPNAGLLLVLLVGIAVYHSFIKTGYTLASNAATVVSLLALHFLNPVGAPPVIDRGLDTLLGATIAFAFSHLLPRWEYENAPRLVGQLLAAGQHYAALCLDDHPPLQAYRLARKGFIDALSAVSESLNRMRGEPRRVRQHWAFYGALLAEAYATHAQLVAIRLLRGHNPDELDPIACARLLAVSREQVSQALDTTRAYPLLDDDKAIPEEGSSRLTVLRLRCTQAVRAAVSLRAAAEKLINLPPTRPPAGQPTR